eukprot:gene9979-2297_t
MDKSDKRIDVLMKQLKPKESVNETILSKNDTSSSGKKSDDIVIVCPVRTAIARAGKGNFRNTPTDKLLEPVLRHILETTKIDPSIVGDIVVGKVLEDGSMGATQVRIASLLAGFPDSVPCTVVNRQCSSGLQALANVAAAISSGMYEVGIAGGVESMSHGTFAAVQKAMQKQINMDAMKYHNSKGCYLPMGLTSENVAKKFNISREQQDYYAFTSQQRALKAQKEGKFVDEIVPVKTIVKDPKTGEEKEVIVKDDEGPRPTTKEGLAKLRAVFKKDGSTTAGNSSQVSDGASAMLVMKRSTAQKLGLKIMGSLVSYAVKGCDPNIMGIGPAVAIPVALEKAGLKVKDIDLWEINEAFASQFGYSVESLGIDYEKVNVNGGAMALGHPLGCTGARQVATLLNEMKKRNSKYGVISMCIGSGMGAAAVIQYEQ